MYRPVCLALSALILPGSALATPLALEPSSQWNLSYDVEACRLGRAFGAEDQHVIAQIIRYTPDPGFELIVSGKMLAPKGRKFEYRFAPGDEANEAQNLLYGERDDGLTMWQLNTGLVPGKEFKKLDNDDPKSRSRVIEREAERAREVSHFEILKGVSQPISLHLGSLEKAMQAMDTCMDDLIRQWGYDPEVQRGRISIPMPKSDPRQWVVSADYPTKPLRDGVSGSVRFRLDVNEQGDVDGCTIQQSLSDPEFREVTCNAIRKRARFKPAIGADGKPTRSFWGNTVVFITN